MFFDRIYNIFFFFFSSQNVKRGGTLAPSMDAPPLPPTLCDLAWGTGDYQVRE